MKTQRLWIIGVILALIVGFLLGRNGSVIEKGDAEASHQANSETIPEGARSQTRHNRRSAKGKGGLAPRSGRVTTLLNEIKAGDYYDLSEASSWPRLCAEIMSLPRSSFPEVMEHLDEMDRDNDNYDALEKLLLQRWADIDPDGSVAWLRQRASGVDLREEARMFNLQIFVIQEAVINNPAWAAENLLTLSKEIELFGEKEGVDTDSFAYPFGDPFSDGVNVSMNLDIFYQRLAGLPIAQRDRLKAELGESLFSYGVSGWAMGLLTNGEIEAYKAFQNEMGDSVDIYGDPFSGYTLAMLAKTDWEKARDLAEEFGSFRSDDDIRTNWRKEDAAAADAWYLARATDASDRRSRIAKVAESIEETKDRRAWIEVMEEKGEPVTEAWEDMINLLKNKKDMDGAIALIPKVDEDSQSNLLESIFNEVSNVQSFYHGKKRVMLIFPDEEFKEFQAAHPDYADYVRSVNQEAAREFRSIIKAAEESLQSGSAATGGE